MDRPTLSTLPEDVLEEIFSHLKSPTVTWGSERAELFRNLCLTCRKILPHARRHLYRNPSYVSRGLENKENALVLLSAVQGNATLGRLVKQLDGVLSSFRRFPKDASGGDSEACLWLCAMFKACPALKSTVVVVSTPEQVAQVVEALHPSLPTLSRVRLCSNTDGGAKLTPALVRQFVATLGADSLEQFEISDIAQDEQTDEPVPLPLLPFAVRRVVLSVSDSHVPFDGIVTCLPTPLHSLRSFEVCSHSFDPESLLSLVKIVGVHLEELAICERSEPVLVGYDEYGALANGISVPLEVFSLLPNIRTLELVSVRCLSVERIRGLSRNSPRLTSLDLTEGFWLGDGPIDKTVPGWQGRLFPQPELAALLSTLANLESVDLGVLPVSRHEPLAEKLVKPLEDKGVYLQYTQTLCAVSDTCKVCSGDQWWWTG
ncbi:hypothetical protein JCM8547_006698 [Rhodosporidiobolus lusitaniae]